MLVGAVQVGTYDQFRDMYKEMGVTSPLCKYSIAYIVRSISAPLMSAVQSVMY